MVEKTVKMGLKPITCQKKKRKTDLQVRFLWGNARVHHSANREIIHPPPSASPHLPVRSECILVIFGVWDQTSFIHVWLLDRGKTFSKILSTSLFPYQLLSYWEFKAWEESKNERKKNEYISNHQNWIIDIKYRMNTNRNGMVDLRWLLTIPVAFIGASQLSVYLWILKIWYWTTNTDLRRLKMGSVSWLKKENLRY